MKIGIPFNSVLGIWRNCVVSFHILRFSGYEPKMPTLWNVLNICLLVKMCTHARFVCVCAYKCLCLDEKLAPLIDQKRTLFHLDFKMFKRKSNSPFLLSHFWQRWESVRVYLQNFKSRVFWSSDHYLNTWVWQTQFQPQTKWKRTYVMSTLIFHTNLIDTYTHIHFHSTILPLSSDWSYATKYAHHSIQQQMVPIYF